MNTSLERTLLTLTLAVVVGLITLPGVYEHFVTASLASALDSQHGKTGWVALWMTADAQQGQTLALFRTLYVRLLFPRVQAYTPWKNLQFTHKTTTPHRPWHFAVCVCSQGHEITYFWSIRQRQWAIAWDNNTRCFPMDVQRDYSARLKSVVRRKGLNWPSGQADEI